MTRYSFHPLILCVLGLSIIGLLYRLYTEPVALIQQALFMILFAGIIFFLVKRFLAHKLSSGNYYSSQPQPRKMNYKASAKSNIVPHKKKKETKKFSRPLVKKRTDVTLTVIEGKKNKKKNRALF
ncbi:MAG: SA1362 family protein [Anaerobacillus sp.]|uniref:SA1362 family protein n=1 Tax=Anaerobacillus sp. TaxID=1872506 RepID=UPI0039190E53